ncbi:hypothetical protein A9Q84_09525 [Halobacteriovorax marinus]|uniref:Uncharacterized protein n=1 Tax=Halobacteriovorax marinus TaxID=97084 RepID=A0A1Y5F6Q0_9BACT|nr:hypothetical protein A9Q84_09525 [Halobacteriovorax marinus]
MDINDYSTRLSQARTNYRDAADDLKEHYSSELEDIDDNNKVTQKKQRENYATSKTNLEAAVAETITDQSKKVKVAIQDRTEQFRNRSAAQVENFENDRQEIKTKFDDRLTYLRDSYDKDLSARERTQKDLLESANERYTDRTKRNANLYQENVNKLDHSTRTAMKEQKFSHDIEKRVQEAGHSNEVQDLVRTGNSSRSKIIDKQHRDLQALRDTQTDSLKHLKHHQEKTIENIHNQKGLESDKMASNFSELTKDISLRNNKNNTRMAKNNREQITSLERQYAQTTYQNKREMEEKLKGGNILDKDQLKSAELGQKFDTRIKNINESIDDMVHKDQLDKERMSSAFQDSVRERNLSHSKHIDKIEKDARDFKNTTVKDNRDRTDQVLNSYRKRLSDVQLESEQKTIKDRQASNQQLRTQREEFGRVVTQLSDMNQEAVTKIQDEQAAEKTKFIQSSRMAHHNQVENLKDDFNNRMANRESSLTQRLEQKDKVFDKTVTQLEEKMVRVEGKAAKEISAMKQIEQERRSEDGREFKRETRKMTDNFTKEKVAMKDGFDRRLSNAKHKSDVRLNETVQKYESQLEIERNDTRRHFKTKIKQLESNYRRLADQSELEKDLIRNQFERRIEETRQNNAMQLEEISREKNSKV